MPPIFKSGRLLSVALAMAGVGIVFLFPGNVAVALTVTIALVAGMYLASGGSVSDRSDLPERIVEEHRLLVESIEGAPIPFAVYDQDDYLIVCNESYENLYGDVFDKLRSRDAGRRIHYAELVRAYSADSMNADELDTYVAERCRAQRCADGTAVDRLYPGFGWLRVTKFATPVAGFAVDINELKDRESALQAQIEKSRMLEERLRSLANTDHLTGLPNRRRFFERLEADFVRRLNGLLPLILAGVLAGCASQPPGNQHNLCSVFSQHPEWYDYAKASEETWGTPAHILMAFVRHESSYRANAKPPYEWFLFIPLGRPSSARGFAQIQDPAWQDYKQERDGLFRSRSSMNDALDFVGWYNDKSSRLLGISKWDPEQLYLAYHEGHTGYRRGSYRNKPGLLRVAQRVGHTAREYGEQLRGCEERFKCRKWYQVGPLCS